MAWEPMHKQEAKAHRPAQRRLVDIVVGVCPPPPKTPEPSAHQQGLVFRKPREVEDVSALLRDAGLPGEGTRPEDVVAPVPLAGEPLRDQPLAGLGGANLLDRAAHARNRAERLLDDGLRVPATPLDGLSGVAYGNELVLALAQERPGRTNVLI